MAQKDGKKTFIARGGAIKWAALDAEYPTGPNYAFSNTVWHDLGIIKKNPTLTPSSTTTTVDFWNFEDITVGSKETYTFDFSSAQFDYENLKLFFNFDEVDEDGGFTPGDSSAEVQMALLLFNGTNTGLLHLPHLTYTQKGAIDWLKDDSAELASTFAVNPSARLNGKPWKFWPGINLAPEAPITVS